MKYIFKNQHYNLQNNTLNLNSLINKFFKDLKINKHVALLVNIKCEGNIVYSIGNRYAVDPTKLTDIQDYINYCIFKEQGLDNRYKILLFSEIIFNYTPISKDDYDKMQQIKLVGNKDLSRDYNLIMRDNLPLNTDYKDWGNKLTSWNKTTYLLDDLTVESLHDSN